jgi:hypothetical protein
MDERSSETPERYVARVKRADGEPFVRTERMRVMCIAALAPSALRVT